MATENRRNSLDLIGALEREPHRFRFFQAIRLLALTGRAANLRFRTPASLAFSPSEITSLRVSPGRDSTPRMEMEVGFMGLTGPAGILPHHYTEILLERRHLHRDGTLHAFLDIFNHRACALFHAAWRKYRFHIAYEQGHRDTFTGHLADLLPARPPLKDGVSAVHRNSLVRFAGLLGRRPLPAVSLAAFLGDHFQVGASLEPFTGQWTVIPPGARTRLGAEAPPLGQGILLGDRFWDQQNKVTLRLGPLTGTQFHGFLPGSPAAEALRLLAGMHLGKFLACDLDLRLTREGVPSPDLGGGARLGLNTWLQTRPLAGNPDPVRFRLQA